MNTKHFLQLLTVATIFSSGNVMAQKVCKFPYQKEPKCTYADVNLTTICNSRDIEQIVKIECWQKGVLEEKEFSVPLKVVRQLVKDHCPDHYRSCTK